MEILGKPQMSHPCINILFVCVAAGIVFLNAVVGNQFLLTLLETQSNVATIKRQWRNAVLDFSD